MKRIVLFSTPNTEKFEEILSNIFPQEVSNKVFAYMPIEGKNCKQEFVDFWQEISKRFDVEFILIDNTSHNSQEEKEKLSKANILVITGGNTFELLHNVRKSSLDKEILEFAKKDEFVIAGWSAGALLLTPSIEVASLPWRDGSNTPMDKNKWKLKDLSGLGLVNFEVFPHYDETLHKKTYEQYSKKKNGNVKSLTNNEVIVLDL